METSSIRVNLTIPLTTSILVEKASEQRGINRVQFIKEAIGEKLKEIDKHKDNELNLVSLKEEMKEIKQLCFIILDKLQN